MKTKYPATFTILLVSFALQCLISRHPSFVDWFAFSPDRGILSLPSLITYQLAHGGWWHFLGNFSFGLPFMAFLESKLGKDKFLEFFLLCGCSSALFQEFLSPGPFIGSSGSISGILAGACLAFGDTVQEHLLGLAFFLVFLIPQLAMAPLGFLTGIGYYGHIGGAIGGILLASRLYTPLPAK